jgi:hypothetical protein
VLDSILRALRLLLLKPSFRARVNQNRVRVGFTDVSRSPFVAGVLSKNLLACLPGGESLTITVCTSTARQIARLVAAFSGF